MRINIDGTNWSVVELERIARAYKKDSLEAAKVYNRGFSAGKNSNLPELKRLAEERDCLLEDLDALREERDQLVTENVGLRERHKRQEINGADVHYWKAWYDLARDEEKRLRSVVDARDLQISILMGNSL